jgi:hypothetical protein
MTQSHYIKRLEDLNSEDPSQILYHQVFDPLAQCILKYTEKKLKDKLTFNHHHP